ncbi:MAG TPA: (2Fe-2S)-binding protein, partial [Roseomonas sp.]
MFAQRPEARPAEVEVFVEDRLVMVPEGASAAAAVLLAGLPAIRETPVSGAPRLPYCMMGVCFDCLAEIDGVANRQACMVPVAPGMRIAPQR